MWQWPIRIYVANLFWLVLQVYTVSIMCLLHVQAGDSLTSGWNTRANCTSQMAKVCFTREISHQLYLKSSWQSTRLRTKTKLCNIQIPRYKHLYRFIWSILEACVCPLSLVIASTHMICRSAIFLQIPFSTNVRHLIAPNFGLGFSIGKFRDWNNDFDFHFFLPLLSSILLLYLRISLSMHCMFFSSWYCTVSTVSL